MMSKSPRPSPLASSRRGALRLSIALRQPLQQRAGGVQHAILAWRSAGRPERRAAATAHAVGASAPPARAGGSPADDSDQPQPQEEKWIGVRRKGPNYEARIMVHRASVTLGHFNTGEEAAREYDKAAVLTKPPARLGLNFPLSDYVDAQGRPLPALDDMRKFLDDAIAGKAPKPPRQEQNKSSHFTGVSKRKQGWLAYASHENRRVWLGCYATEEEAARSRDKAVLRLRPDEDDDLNFPLADYVDGNGQLLPDLRIDALVRGDSDAPALAGKTKAGNKPVTQKKSRYTGVSPEPKGTWRARIRVNGAVVQLGMYRKEEDAARAWDQAALRARLNQRPKCNFPREDYFDAQGNLKPAPHIDAMLKGHL